MTVVDLDLRDQIASVLHEQRHRSSRAQANAVVDLIAGRRTTAAKPPPAACPRCTPWLEAVKDPSVRGQTIDVAVSMGREVPLLRFLFAEIDRLTIRRAG